MYLTFNSMLCYIKLKLNDTQATAIPDGTVSKRLAWYKQLYIYLQTK